MNEFSQKHLCEDEIDFSELIVEIDRFQQLVRSSDTICGRSASAIGVL